MARHAISEKVTPQDIQWMDAKVSNPSLFEADGEPDWTHSTPAAFHVPKAFLDVAPKVAAHRSPQRWELLYRVLYRIRFENRELMQIVVDDDIHLLSKFEKQVRRDVHKMKAFVRFREVQDATMRDGESHFVAWHRPDHYIVPLAGPFFARRFAGMRWSILTPDASAHWDGQTLRYGDGADVGEAPRGDELETLWRTYYASIFNPARVKIDAMKAELPVRHWPTLPESELIPELIRNADSRVQDMIRKTEGIADTAAGLIPEHADLSTLARLADACTACPLHEPATQTVFGQGPEDARIVLVGEQPGDREDRAGEPFVGPAGQLLDEVLGQTGLQRDDLYVTNVVKHFKFTPRGNRRIHQKPTSREIFACRPWLEAELDRTRPEVLVCLGATAAQALFGRDFRITKSRGEFIASEWCDRTIATWHPAAVLRNPDAGRQAAMKDEMVRDLTAAARAAAA